MVTIFAGPFFTGFFDRIIGAAIVPIRGGLNGRILDLAHGAIAGLDGRQRHEYSEYQYQVFHAFVSIKSQFRVTDRTIS